MKKVISLLATVTLTLGVSLVAAQPAAAYTYREGKVWSFVRGKAPIATSVIGKRQTVKMARLTCEVLDDGYDIYDVVDAITSDAGDLSDAAADEYTSYAAATVVAAITYLCPRHTYQLDEL